jgi:hypothetical protein
MGATMFSRTRLVVFAAVRAVTCASDNNENNQDE